MGTRASAVGVLAVAILLAGAKCEEDEPCKIGPILDTQSEECMCGGDSLLEDETPVESCEATDFDDGLCCQDADLCTCLSRACASDQNGRCRCGPEFVFDFEAEDTRTPRCEPPPGGQCCEDPTAGMCSCVDACDEGEIVVASCSVENVGCLQVSLPKVEVERCG